jgi:hypothetical protein
LTAIELRIRLFRKQDEDLSFLRMFTVEQFVLGGPMQGRYFKIRYSSDGIEWLHQVSDLRRALGDKALSHTTFAGAI